MESSRTVVVDSISDRAVFVGLHLHRITVLNVLSKLDWKIGEVLGSEIDVGGASLTPVTSVRISDDPDRVEWGPRKNVQESTITEEVPTQLTTVKLLESLESVRTAVTE